MIPFILLLGNPVTLGVLSMTAVTLNRPNAVTL